MAEIIEEIAEGFMMIVDAIGKCLISNDSYLVTAESCTGGLLSAELTAAPGCSHWFERGFITYSNEAKVECLGVTQESLMLHGAVSEQVAREMALGAVKNSRARIALATTGVAGPDGATEAKPVGLVWFALADNDLVYSKKAVFFGDRQAIRKAAVQFAIKWLHDFTLGLGA